MTSFTLNSKDNFTWHDYQRWNDKERWEIINGEAYAMAPSPGFRHQDISMNLSGALCNFFKQKECRPFAAPFDVKLSEHDIVQPDLMVVCDHKIIKDTHIEGAPKLIIEIVSPSSESRDRIAKLKLYEKYMVQEYWLVTPFPPMLEMFFLDESGRFHLHSGGTIDDTIVSPSFPELRIDLTALFDISYTQEEREVFQVKETRTPYQASPS